MNEITALIPCNIWTFLLIVSTCLLIVSIADRWDQNERYNKLKQTLNEQNQEHLDSYD